VTTGTTTAVTAVRLQTAYGVYIAGVTNLLKPPTNASYPGSSAATDDATYFA
jgi:hypothetical protein